MRTRTPEQNRELSRQMRLKLVAEHKCVRCCCRLPKSYALQKCAECSRVVSIKRCTGVYQARINRVNERIAFLVKTAGKLPAMKQAQVLGIPVNAVYFLRTEARKRGIDLPTDYAGVLRYRRSRTKWDVLDEQTERCRCGLLLPCNDCIPEHVDPWQRKGGPSYPEPGGCTFTREEKAHMGKVESKFVRFTNAKRDAARGAR